MSRMMSFAPTASTDTARDGAWTASFSATTTSTGSTISRRGDLGLGQNIGGVRNKSIIEHRFADLPVLLREEGIGYAAA